MKVGAAGRQQGMGKEGKRQATLLSGFSGFL